MRKFLSIALAGALILTVTGTALAGGNGRSGGGGSGTSPYTVTISPAGPYTFGESIYVTTTAPIYPNNTGPWIELKCYQGTVLVASGDHAGFAAGWYYGWPFQLGPTQTWTSGSAKCTVTVFHQSRNKNVTDATTAFDVSG